MRNFLATTAIAVVMATGATGAFAAAHTNMFIQEAGKGEMRASEFIGMRLYAAEIGEDDVANLRVRDNMLVSGDNEREWDDIGEVKDVLMSRDGMVTAVLVDIGGFLGLGEKTVAVGLDQIKFVSENDEGEGEYFLVINGTEESLKNAPEFDTAILDGDIMDNETVEGDMTGQVDVNNANAVEGASTTETDMAKTETDMAKTETATDPNATATDPNAMATTTTEVPADPNAAATTTTEVPADPNAAATTTAEAPADPNAAPMATDNATPMATDNMANDRAFPPTDFAVDGYSSVDYTQLTAEDLDGARVYGINDEDVGEISSLLLSDDGKIEAAVIDVGGFLGIGKKSVQVNFDQLSVQKENDGRTVRIYIDASEDSLKQLPEYEG